MLKTSLIIATYNWVGALDLVLQSIQKQSVLPNEIIIADDGSKKDTTDLIKLWQKKSKVSIIHIWHEDNGFQLSQIRNKAIDKAQYEYIIQIDGDIILHKHFVKDHLKFAKKNCFITGSRTLILEEATKELFTKYKTLNFLSKGIKNRFNAIRFPLFNLFYKPENELVKNTVKIRGCNMSFWKIDLLAVNGYDEDFVGWGCEDYDIVIRLIKKGCYRQKIKLACIQFHLHHKENSKNNLEENNKLLDNAISKTTYAVKNGITKK